MQLSESEIITLIKQDKDAGIRELFNRYYKPLVLFADEFLKDSGVAEDLVQEFYVRLWEDEYLKNVFPSALSSYLFASVRNSCIKYGIKKDVLKDATEITDFDIPIETFSSIDEPEIQRVMKEMELLPEQTRRVVEGIVIKELKYKEVAQELNISVNTVKTLLQRGIRRMQESVSSVKKTVLFFFLSNK